MRSSSAIAAAAAFMLAGTPVEAQSAQGFAVERLYPSAPGAGWFVMDTLDMHGGIGGALSLTAGYAHDPFVAGRSSVSGQALAVVSDQAFAAVAAAVTYDRFRLYLNLDSPLAVRGQSGVTSAAAAGTGIRYTAPTLTLGNTPDTLSDVRIGLDARVLGEAHDAFRLGVSAQVYVPSGNRADYVTDGTVRAMGRLLVAGDVGGWCYAGHLGLHLRPLSEVAIEGGPQGSELLFGAAFGRTIAVAAPDAVHLIVGPEVFGESALSALGGTETTGVEGLLSVRVEGTAEDREQLRLKLGVGAGLDPRFGAPQWRLVFSVEGFDLNGKGAR